MAGKNQVINEINNKYGKLTVKKRGTDKIENDGHPRARWWCECSCGFKCVLVVGKLLRSGRTKSCGCLYKEMALARNKKEGNRTKKESWNIEGKTYDMLTVIRRGPNRVFPSGGSHMQWYCICACNSNKEILKTGNWLRTAKVFKSCGCMHSNNRHKAYLKTNSISQRTKKHKQDLAFYGKAILIGDYEYDDKKTQYQCLIHNEIHYALPTNMGRGRGLECCKRLFGRDTITSILDGNLRAPERECSLYLFNLARFEGYIKLGISCDLSTRPDEEYGDLISQWVFDNRVDACLVENSLKIKTNVFKTYPLELEEWVGVTEIRKIREAKIIKIADYLVNEFHELGKWRFALDHIPMSKENKIKVLDKINNLEN